MKNFRRLAAVTCVVMVVICVLVDDKTGAWACAIGANIWAASLGDRGT